MTHTTIIVVLTVLAVALGIMISISAANLKVPIDQHAAASRAIAESPNPDLRLSRVHLLLSSMK